MWVTLWSVCVCVREVSDSNQIISVQFIHTGSLLHVLNIQFIWLCGVCVCICIGLGRRMRKSCVSPQILSSVSATKSALLLWKFKCQESLYRARRHRSNQVPLNTTRSWSSSAGCDFIFGSYRWQSHARFTYGVCVCVEVGSCIWMVVVVAKQVGVHLDHRCACVFHVHRARPWHTHWPRYEIFWIRRVTRVCERKRIISVKYIFVWHKWFIAIYILGKLILLFDVEVFAICPWKLF